MYRELENAMANSIMQSIVAIDEERELATISGGGKTTAMRCRTTRERKRNTGFSVLANSTRSSRLTLP